METVTLADELRTIQQAEQDALSTVSRAREDTRALVAAAEEEGRQLVTLAAGRAAEEVARYRDAEIARAEQEVTRIVESAERDAAELRSLQQELIRDAAGLIVQAVTGERDVLPC